MKGLPFSILIWFLGFLFIHQIFSNWFWFHSIPFINLCALLFHSHWIWNAWIGPVKWIQFTFDKGKIFVQFTSSISSLLNFIGSSKQFRWFEKIFWSHAGYFTWFFLLHTILWTYMCVYCAYLFILLKMICLLRWQCISAWTVKWYEKSPASQLYLHRCYISDVIPWQVGIFPINCLTIEFQEGLWYYDYLWLFYILTLLGVAFYQNSN